MRSPKLADSEETDLTERLIEETGCAKLHYAVQECYSEKRDWRRCKDILDQFKRCMEQRNPERVAKRKQN
uniref:CHCH domain-containing protein n=1 Tax=Trichuris muris TaxID=70415 RepID=A0A5S6QKY2_TRIMR